MSVFSRTQPAPKEEPSALMGYMVIFGTILAWESGKLAGKVVVKSVRHAHTLIRRAFDKMEQRKHPEA